MISRNDVQRMAAKLKTARVALMQACIDVDAVRDEDEDPALEDAAEFLAEAFQKIRAAEDRVSVVEVK